MKKTCPKCKLLKKSSEFGSHVYCKLCAKAYICEWRRKNPEKAKAIDKKYREGNREVLRERTKRFREENPGYVAEYKNNNREKILKQQREHKREKRRLGLDYTSPEAIRRKNSKRRASKAKAEGSHSPEEFYSLCKQYGNICLKCRSSDLPLTADHVIPLSKGGSDSIENIQPLCLSCNSGKGSRIMDYRKDK
jgi:5-methylcytosine-specific restriction endonuclease McrA